LGAPEVLDQNQAATAVVRIFAAKEQDVHETGSGIYLEKMAGTVYILTAYHVVEEAEIKVEFLTFPGRRFQAKLLKADEDLDLAVITVRYVPSHITDTLTPFRTGHAQDSGELANTPLPVLLYKDLTPPIAQEFRLGQLEGALISYVLPGSNAHAAGLRRGDLVIAADGSPIRDSAGLVARIKAMPEGEAVELTWFRRGERIRARVRVGKRHGTMRPVYTIGHPPGKEWSWQAGYIIGHDTPESLSIAGTLVSGGISGGPLFDEQFRVIGIVTAKATEGTAVRIEHALEFVEALRVPQKFWLTQTFCERLREVIAHGDKDFEEVKVGSGQRAMELVQHYEWVWDASVDLSGRGRSKIIKERGGATEYQAEMADILDTREAEIVLREIGRSIIKCHPSSYVHRMERGLRIEYYIGGGRYFADYIYQIYVYKFSTVIEIHIESKR
jgi:S1-C subfamily serine protease